MSPRSSEFISQARDALREAALLLSQGLNAGAVSRAYYGVLYAARAALSEEDRHARTHRGTWALFREVFVETKRFDATLFAEAQTSQRVREAADYEAAEPPADEAKETVEQAARFVDAVSSMLE